MKTQDFEKLRSKINEIISNEEIAELIKKNDSLKTIVEEYNTALMELEMQSIELFNLQISLQNEKQKYKDLFYKSPVAFAVVDVNGNVVNINDAAKTLLNITTLNMQNNPFITNLVTTDLPKFYNYLNNVINSHIPIKEEFTLVDINHDKKSRIEFIGVKFNEPNTEKNLIRIVFNDITERYELQLRTEELYQQITSMLMNGNMAWWRMNVKTLKTDYHPLKAEILGYTVEEFSNDVMKIMSFVHPEDYQKAWTAMEKHLRGELPNYEVNYRIKCKDGTYKWIMDRGQIAKYDEIGNPELVIGIFTDISQIKQVEEELIKERNKLFAANEAKSKFVSVLSHDLRSPIATIINYIELLKDRFDIFDESKKKEIINTIYDISKSSLNLIENLLEWARSDSDRIQISKTKVEVNGYLRQQLDVFKNAAKLKNIRLEITGEKNLMINTDLNLFSAIVRNLVSNAVKFSRHNSVVYLDYYKVNDMIVFSVRDTGIGMNENQVNELFSLTHFFSRRGTAGERGTGLGLKIVKEYIHKLGGKIWVTSELNLGTTFYFSLPIE